MEVKDQYKEKHRQTIMLQTHS